MLILSRRIGEAITIGPEVTVTIVAIKGNQVRVGVQAPKAVDVLRQELLVPPTATSERFARQEALVERFLDASYFG